MKADRLLSVLLLLQARGRVSERELAEQLEVSQRTIHRDLEALSAARVPVVALRGAQGGWQLEKGWRTHVPGLDEAELRALLMAQPRALGHPRLVQAAESALNKLMAAMPGPLRAQAATMRERLLVDPTGWREVGEDLSMLAVVQDAVARERKLTFDYTRADGQKAPRTVDPLGLVVKGMTWYLVARSANGLRTYRVSRMESVAILAVGFERPSRFDLAAFWKKSTTELQQKAQRYAAIVSLDQATAQKLRRWYVTRPVPESDAGPDRVILEVEFDSEEQARFVALGLGSAVQVVRPEVLRDWIQSEVQLLSVQSWAQGAEK